MINFWQLIQFLLSPAIVLGLIAYPAKKYVDYLINRSAANQEQKYKKELSGILDERRHGFDKDLKSFAFFVEKKFEIYTTLYEKTKIALRALSSLTGFSSVPDFTRYSEADLSEYLDKHEFLKSEKTEYLLSFVSNPTDAANRLHREMYRRDFVHVKKLIIDANSFFNINQLFVSDQLEEKFDKFFKLLVSNYVEWKSCLLEDCKIDTQKLRSEEGEREDTMQEIKRIMKMELRNTYLGNMEI